MDKDIKLANGDCFWGHTWTVWTQYTSVMMILETGRKFLERRQKRHCVKCNKEEDVAVY